MPRAGNVTSDDLLPWVGAGFLASGAAATDEAVEDAATPFDRRRHGMILGMGAAAVVIEDAASAEERAIRPSSKSSPRSPPTAPSTAPASTSITFQRHGGPLVTGGSVRREREEVAPGWRHLHETYTPPRRCPAAEVASLRSAFGPAASQIVIANTKAFTGHPMGVGIEDVVAIDLEAVWYRHPELQGGRSRPG